jgi:hypothetical protein
MASHPGWIGAQQAQLQQQRHAILKAALDGQFAVRPFVAADGANHHTIHLTSLPSPEIAIQLLTEPQLRTQLALLEKDERVRDGGLHYLIGEPSVFWSMVRHYLQTGSTTSNKWDALIQLARLGQVDCMFFRSAAGCVNPSCPFDHVPKTFPQPPVMSMATSNAMLGRVPSLGFGASLSSQDRLDALAGLATPPNAEGYTIRGVEAESRRIEDDILSKHLWGMLIGETEQQKSTIW